MTFWGTALDRESIHPKQKSRFIVELGNGGWMLSLSSITKPAVTIEKKEYRMINHYYNYPGIPKWEPITMTFVDNQIWGHTTVTTPSVAVDAAPAPDGLYPYSPALPTANTKSTSGQLFEMLLATGYVTPSALGSRIKDLARVVSPEKAASIAQSFGTTFTIYQLAPEGFNKASGKINHTEMWTLHNPIITKISWGDLDYGSDDLVQYTLDVSYDWAEHSDVGAEDPSGVRLPGPNSK
jgi:hypothetical protein